MSNASHSLATFQHDPQTFASLLVRLAISDDSPASTAVFQSLLAVSSFYRYGSSKESIRLKLSALRAMGLSSRNDIGLVEGIQQVAAGMLLCSLEVQGCIFSEIVD